MDFNKAFDLIKNRLLFLKLFYYDFDNNSLLLLTDYFKDRRQITKIGSESSSSVDLKIGVPQGSVLGLLLLLIYINYLLYSVEIHCCLFADNTTIFISCDYLADYLVKTVKFFFRKLIPF